MDIIADVLYHAGCVVVGICIYQIIFVGKKKEK